MLAIRSEHSGQLRMDQSPSFKPNNEYNNYEYFSIEKKIKAKNIRKKEEIFFPGQFRMAETYTQFT
ncbi:hypothetical protein BpHYR1_012224 [Brachionus plicatilis]|uniref:Uncharacterized protein n=1 Tax=Brachionus plicatilis TaxID=10195 RepID=A0A3M7P291_BRAPC|nr:hypothetical protein BpHYR1_012224 [Brachionus plicatilis]